MWPVRLKRNTDDVISGHSSNYCLDTRMFTGLDFWNAPDRWDGIENLNLRSPNGQAFWMIDREAKQYIPPAPPPPLERLIKEE